MAVDQQLLANYQDTLNQDQTLTPEQRQQRMEAFTKFAEQVDEKANGTTDRNKVSKSEAQQIEEQALNQLKNMDLGERAQDGSNTYNPRRDLNMRVPCIITTEQRLHFYGREPGNFRKGKARKDIDSGDLRADATWEDGRSAYEDASADKQGMVWMHGGYRQAPRFMYMTFNPSQVSIQQGLRVADSKTKSGTVQYFWEDPQRRTFFDEPKVTFHFQSGNISPFTYLADVQKLTGKITAEDLRQQPIPSGLADFYDFLTLLDEDRIALDGRPNYCHIAISSNKFRNLSLVGFWDPEGVSIDDTAEEPNQLNWQCTMTVRSTYPELFNSQALKQMFFDNRVSAM